MCVCIYIYIFIYMYCTIGAVMKVKRLKLINVAMTSSVGQQVSSFTVFYSDKSFDTQGENNLDGHKRFYSMMAKWRENNCTFSNPVLCHCRKNHYLCD